MNNKKKQKIFTWRINLFLLSILGLGICIGIGINRINFNSLEGYNFSFNNLRDVETNSLVNIYGDNDESCDDATSSNATSCNATSSNATSSNATSSDVSKLENAIYLTRFSLKTNETKAGQKVYIDFGVKGNCLQNASIVLKNVDLSLTYTIELQFSGNDVYFELPQDMIDAKYDITDVLLVAKGYDCKTFSKLYTTRESVSNSYKLEFKNSITLKSDKVKTKLKLNSITLGATQTYVNQKVPVNISTDAQVNNVKIVFVNNSNEKITTYIKSLGTGSDYISFPSNTKEGEYKIYSIILATSDNTTIYCKDRVSGTEYFDFKNTISIQKQEDTEQNNVFEYNNEDMTDSILSSISSSPNNAVININADVSPIISAELFKIIKGTNKKLIINYKENLIIFNGVDIENIKDIDVTLDTKNNNEDTDIKKLVSNYQLLKFASNGELPGNATINVKALDSMKTILNDTGIYMYYFNETYNKFELIDSNICLNEDGYYEINLRHNSSYILVNSKLDQSLIATREQMETGDVIFLNSNYVYILIAGIATILIIVVIIIIVVVKKKNKKLKANLKEEKTTVNQLHNNEYKSLEESNEDNEKYDN